MEFQKIVEGLLEENASSQGNDKKGVIAGSITTNTGRYASAQVGTSAGVIAPRPQTASSEKQRSFAEKNNAKADDDTTTTRKSNATRTDSHRNSFKPCRGGAKEGKSGSKRESKGSNKSKGTIIKYKPVDFGGEWQWS